MIHTESDIDRLAHEQQQIDVLLKDKDFAYKVAKNQHDAYYVGVGENPPAFWEEDEESKTIEKNVKEEKIAMNLAGFYALECGLGALCSRDGEKPTDWLRRIIGGEMDVKDILLLNHFANATWKAGQPFRAIERITRPVFTVFSLLPEADSQKDFVQIQTAANQLLRSLEDTRDSSAMDQMLLVRDLIQDETFSLEMAMSLAAAYYTGQNQEAPPFISREEEMATVNKSLNEEKIAINLAGFYALESGIDYLASIQGRLPSEVLKSIIDETIFDSDKQLLTRFANATWKAGQPFRGLDRITREIFTPFDFLSEDDVAKDWAQMKGAAEVLYYAMNSRA